MQHKAPLTSQDSHLIGRYLKIVKHHRRIGGSVGAVRDVFWKGNEPWVVVQLTSGLQVAVAYGWTDLPPQAYPCKPEGPEILPSGLVKMAHYWHSRQAYRRTLQAQSQRKRR